MKHRRNATRRAGGKLNSRGASRYANAKCPRQGAFPRLKRVPHSFKSATTKDVRLHGASAVRRTFLSHSAQPHAGSPEVSMTPGPEAGPRARRRDGDTSAGDTVYALHASGS